MENDPSGILTSAWSAARIAYMPQPSHHRHRNPRQFVWPMACSLYLHVMVAGAMATQWEVKPEVVWMSTALIAEPVEADAAPMQPAKEDRIPPAPEDGAVNGSTTPFSSDAEESEPADENMEDAPEDISTRSLEPFKAMPPMQISKKTAQLPAPKPQKPAAGLPAARPQKALAQAPLPQKTVAAASSQPRTTSAPLPVKPPPAPPTGNMAAPAPTPPATAASKPAVAAAGKAVPTSRAPGRNTTYSFASAGAAAVKLPPRPAVSPTAAGNVKIPRTPTAASAAPQAAGSRWVPKQDVAPVQVAAAQKPVAKGAEIGPRNVQPAPPPPEPVFDPPARGDLELMVAGNTVGTGALKIQVLFCDYPKIRHKRPLTRAERKKVKMLTPKESRTGLHSAQAVIEHAPDGIYEFRGVPGNVQEGFCTVTVHGKSGAPTIKRLGTRTLGGGTVIFKVLMPEGAIWEDNTSFSGTIESSESITKYNSDTGLMWQEYR